MGQADDFKERKKRVEKLKAQINKSYGSEVLLSGTEALKKGVLSKNVIPSPSLELNNALYCGGFSGIVELFGSPASGKTSLAIETLTLAQKNDPEMMALWLETEHSIYSDILFQHGVDFDRLLYINQEDVDNAENALDIVYSAVASNTVQLVIINSVAGLAPKKETEEEISKQNVALVARIMSKFFRKITGAAGKNKVTMIFINQVRDNVGVMFGDPSTTTGGKALGFYASQRIKMNANKVQASDPITADEGIKVSCIVHKNRMAGMHNPYTKCVYYARFKEGIDSIVSIPQLLLDRGVFIRKGAWWYYLDENGNPRTIDGVECKFSSQNNLIDTLRNNVDFRNSMLALIDNENVDTVSDNEREEIEKTDKENEEFFKAVEASDNVSEE